MIHQLIHKLRRIKAQTPHLQKALRLVWTAAPGWTSLWLALLIVQGILPVATVYLLRSVVNRVTILIRSPFDPDQARSTIVLVVAMVVVHLLAESLRAITTWVKATESELVQDYINSMIHKKSIEVDLAFYESPDFFDHLHMARSESTYRPVALLENISALLQNTLTLLAMAVVLIPFGYWIPFALLMSTLPALFVILRYVDLHHGWKKQNAADVRWAFYYSNLLTMRETAQELRSFDLGEYFKSAYERLRKRLRGERLQIFKEQRRSELIAGLLGYSISGGATAWMVWRALLRSISLGDLAMFYQAFTQGQRLMRSLLENLGQIYENSLFLGNLFEFMDLKSEVVSPEVPAPSPVTLKEGITFRNVTFGYPGSDRLVLQDFSLTIPAGQVVAIVGPNGAGKSTLIKLLCRFYDPQEGQIQFDGTDLRRFGIEELRRMITVLFQEPVRYNATAAENIRLGDLQSGSDGTLIRNAAKAAGADRTIERLPQEYDTLLGKWFVKGNDLSVGEWQRIALARAFLRKAPIILLDEPTSAMDPWAEADWFDRYRQLVKDRTSLIITHRFTTAMQADWIHVVLDGKIIESGSHKDLISFGGHYARSWLSQMETRTVS